MDFQSEKSFGKLRLRAFQPYHQILCILKHVEDVEDYLRHLRHASTYIGSDGWKSSQSQLSKTFFELEDGKRTYRHILAHNFLNN